MFKTVYSITVSLIDVGLGRMIHWMTFQDVMIVGQAHGICSELRCEPQAYIIVLAHDYK